MTNQQLERVVKGIANHRRLLVLQLLRANPNQAVGELARQCNTDFRNASQHLQKMVGAGLVYKQQQGNEVLHYLSPRGKRLAGLIKQIN